MLSTCPFTTGILLAHRWAQWVHHGWRMTVLVDDKNMSRIIMLVEVMSWLELCIIITMYSQNCESVNVSKCFKSRPVLLQWGSGWLNGWIPQGPSAPSCWGVFLQGFGQGLARTKNEKRLETVVKNWSNDEKWWWIMVNTYWILGTMVKYLLVNDVMVNRWLMNVNDG